MINPDDPEAERIRDERNKELILLLCMTATLLRNLALARAEENRVTGAQSLTSFVHIIESTWGNGSKLLADAMLLSADVGLNLRAFSIPDDNGQVH